MSLLLGSLSSCDEFIATFHSRGLRPETVCPCACSPEGLTVSVRRPGRVGAGSSGRGVLSMAALSCGVIRVDLENSLTSLTIQVCDIVNSYLYGLSESGQFSDAVKCLNASRTYQVKQNAALQGYVVLGTYSGQTSTPWGFISLRLFFYGGLRFR